LVWWDPRPLTAVRRAEPSMVGRYPCAMQYNAKTVLRLIPNETLAPVVLALL
jgi:hypothetical protein